MTESHDSDTDLNADGDDGREWQNWLSAARAPSMSGVRQPLNQSTQHTPSAPGAIAVASAEIFTNRAPSSRRVHSKASPTEIGRAHV